MIIFLVKTDILIYTILAYINRNYLFYYFLSMEKKHWLVFLEMNQHERENFRFYFEKNENNIAAFEVIKELIAEDKQSKICPEFVGTEEDILNLPKYSLNYYGCIELRKVVK